MSIFDVTNNIMNTVSNSLLFPVILVLVILAFLSLILIGEFLSEYAKRNRNSQDLKNACLELHAHVEQSNYRAAADTLRNVKQTFIVTSFAQAAAEHMEKNRIPAIEWLSQEYEIKMSKKLEFTRIISTTGPMLGLMGTLIPLGPALVALAGGDLLTLANNLMIAFATTVVGLFAASITFVLTQIRKRWYWQDMADIDYILDSIEVKA